MTCTPAWLAVCGNRGSSKSPGAISSILTFTDSRDLTSTNDLQVLDLASSLRGGPSKNKIMPMAMIPSARRLRGIRTCPSHALGASTEAAGCPSPVKRSRGTPVVLPKSRNAWSLFCRMICPDSTGRPSQPTSRVVFRSIRSSKIPSRMSSAASTATSPAISPQPAPSRVSSTTGWTR